MINSIKMFIALVATAIVATSCLDKYPGSAIPTEKAMKTYDDALQVNTGIYAMLKSSSLYTGYLTYLPDVQSLQLVDFDVWNRISAEMAAAGTIPQALQFADRNAMMAYINETVAPFIASDVYAPYVAPIAGLGNLNILGIIKFTIYKYGNGWFVLPLLSIASQIFMQKLTMQNTQMDPSQAGTSKTMLYMMTFMSLYFCAIYNSAFALYWVVSNIYAIAENVAFTKYFESQDRKAAKAEEVGI